MAGGTWTTQNKTLPGVYTNIVGEGPNPSVLGDRGIVALEAILPWLDEQTVLTLYPSDIAQFVADYGEFAVPVREAMKNASQLYIYRLNKGTKATATIGNLICTARYSGTFGNFFAVSIENVLGQQSGKLAVVTWMGADEMDRQIVESIEQLEDNGWISFSALEGSNTLAINAGTPLKSGANGTVTTGDYAKFLSDIESYTFNAIACTSDDIDVKNLFTAFVKRMVSEEGKYMQCVVPDMSAADFEAVISVKNGVYLEGGEHIPNTIACAYIAGATASVPLSESLTNANYKGAVDVDQRYNVTQQTELAQSGQLVFISSPSQSNRVVVQKDINTLTSFDDTHTYAMSKNKVIRIVQYLAANIAAIAYASFIGKTPNDAEGRSRYHSNVLTDLFRELEKQRALQDVTPEDIVVTKGTNIDSIVVDYTAKVVDVIEIIYGTIRVQG